MAVIAQLPGYHFHTLLYEGSRTLVYRGTRERDQSPVVVKVLRNQFPDFGELVRFRNQYIMTRHLSSPYWVQPLALERYENRYALVMPDEGAIALSLYWPQAPRSLQETVKVAIQLADALRELAQECIIHKDIKPGNILIHPESQKVKLIDFSLSSLLPKEKQQLTNPKVLEGTLAYISPEQTGRMNRSLDYRTDFYSLGATLFELLMGHPPFGSSDPMELLHCHLAKSVEFLNCSREKSIEQSTESIPGALQAIVIRLMAKNAEERYQSASGLKHDLECCLKQLETTNKIAAFELGTRDVCDRFLIPEKLYGREKEVKCLLDAFDRISGRTSVSHKDSPHISQTPISQSELILVTGFSGIGKTAIVREIHKPITQQQGYFIQGKFDQLNRDVPFSAFVQAFRSLINQVLSESEQDLADWKNKILTAVGQNGQVLLDVIPELVHIIGSQPLAPTLSGGAAQNRFNLLFSRFLKLFSTFEHPLVIFLDDLQWVDSASLNLLKLLMEDESIEYLLVLGAYRNNEVHSSHPLVLALDELEQQGAVMTTLTLEPLSEVDVNTWVADTFLCSAEISQPFSQLLYQKTRGNPFFTTQFLQGLHRDGWITFDRQQGHWQCDLAEVRQLALTDDIVAFMVERLQKLPKTTQSALKLASCIGNRFNLDTLARICNQSEDEVAANLWRGLQAGFVIPESEIYKFFQGRQPQEAQFKASPASNSPDLDSPDVGAQQAFQVGYRFLHDRVQQAAYALIPESQKQQTHWKIGQRLLHQTSIEERAERLFEIVNQLNAGRNWGEAELDSDRHSLISLNQQAGRKARAATAYSAALSYFQVGLELLPPHCWETHYTLTLEIYDEVIEAAYLSLQFDLVDSFVQDALTHSHQLLDRIKIHEIQIQDAIGRNQLLKALDLGFDILEQLGVPLLDPEQVDITLPCLETLADHPKMIDPHQQAALRIFVSMFSAVYNGKPSLLKPTIWTMAHLCTTAGHTSVSPMAYTVYGMSCCGSGNIETGYRSGQIALKLLDLLDAKEVRCKALEQVGGFISHWKEHVSVSIEQFNEGLKSGLDVGDLEYACHAAKNACAHLVLLGESLDQVQNKQAQYIDLGRILKQQHILSFATIWRQLSLNLMGQVSNTCELVGESFNEREMLPVLKEKNNYFSLYVIHFSKLMLCYLFDDLKQAKEMLVAIDAYSQASLGSLMSVVQNFYSSLILLQDERQAFHPYGPNSRYSNAPAPRLSSSSEILNQRLKRVDSNQVKMRHWAKFSPMNHQHKYELVEAERFRNRRDYVRAMECYERAIAGAKKNHYCQEEALANELAAHFYLDWGKERIAAAYLQEAYYCYARWGAKAKTEALEQAYPRLLAPILRSRHQELNLLETLTDIAPHTSTHSSIAHSKNSSQEQSLENSSSSRINTALDLTSILRASQVISSRISIEDLLSQLTQIILRTSGADYCAILLPTTDGRWQLRATSTAQDVSLCSEFLNETSSLPVQLIQYVCHTQEAIAANAPYSDLPFIDPYLNQQQPKSILGLPLLSQGKLIATLYLSNQITRDVFTQERRLVLHFLCTEAAVSLEKAQLYQELEDYSVSLKSQVEARTQDLQAEVKERERAQIEMQAAKEAAELANQAKSEFLANMTHELRSPLNAILGFARLMQQSPHVPSDHRDNAGIIYRSGSHLLSLINDILDISKIEAGHTHLHETDFDLQQLLADIYRLFQLDAQTKDLQFTYKLDEATPRYIHADQRKLRQILINIVGNAIKFTEVGNIHIDVGLTPTPSSEVGVGQQLRFRIQDTGPGMASEEISQAFEPFVQTRSGQDSQRGSGLGLAISQRFAEMMGGRIWLSSCSENSETTATTSMQQGEAIEEGTTVTFEIQVRAIPSPILDEHHPERPLLGLAIDEPSYRILVVDDQAYNRRLLKKLLLPLGFEVQEATDGQEAIRQVQRWHPDLIWLDLHMPELDGYGVAKRIRKLGLSTGNAGKPLRIVALSASHVAQARERAIAAGCDAFITKPFDAYEIFDGMKQQLGLKYRYKTDEIDGLSSAIPTLSKQELRATLLQQPEKSLQQLEAALKQGQWQQIMEWTEQIRETEPKLAEYLSETLYNFDYRPILEALHLESDA